MRPGLQSTSPYSFIAKTVSTALLLVLKIAALPGLDEFSPGSGIKYIHGRRLARITRLVGNIAELKLCRFAAITGNRFHENAALCSIGVFPRDLNVIIIYFGIYKIPRKLCRSGARPYDRGR